MKIMFFILKNYFLTPAHQNGIKISIKINLKNHKIKHTISTIKSNITSSTTFHGTNLF
jgi:hypothetical protein